MAAIAGGGSRLPLPPIWLVYVVGFVPAVVYVWLGINDQLGADPQNVLERALGLWSLRFLVAGLAISPLRRSFGINLIRYRRAIGLLAFWYACLHLLVYLVLDQGLNWPAIWADILKRPYITIGMAGFVLLVPLALTSNNLSIRRLGAEAWNRLHRLVYAAALAGAVHFVMLVKVVPGEPLLYIVLVALLLAYRIVEPRLRKPNERRRKIA